MAKSSRNPKSFVQFAEVGTLGTWGTVLAILSTIVGGGMLGIPWACL
jgi:amino acid permease